MTSGLEVTEFTMGDICMPAQKPISLALWRDRSFLLFWSGRAASLLGTSITGVALPLLMYRLTASAFLTSLLAALEVLPYFIFGFFAGALADRMDRRRIMVSCDLLNVLLLGSIPLAYWLNVLTIPHIFIVALLSASAFVWFDAADFGALPTLVGRDHIIGANSAITSMSTIVGIAGPALGGSLTALLGSAPTLSFDALSYLLSALTVLLIPRALNTISRTGRGSSTQDPGMAASIWEGLTFLWRHRLVRTLTLLSFGLSLSGGALLGLLVVYAVRALTLPVTDARIGLLFAAGSLGSFAASLLLPQLTRRLPVGWISLLGMSLNLLLLLILAAWVSILSIALVVYACWSLTYTLTTTNGISLRQLVIPDHLQSRVNAYARMIAWGGTPFGAVLGGLLTQLTSIRPALLIMACGLAISLLIGYFSPLREKTRVRDLIQKAD